MLAASRYLGQAAVYTLIAVLFGVFATWPTYRPFDPQMAQLTLSLAHSGKRPGECKRLTAKEIAALPALERKPLDCERGRLPVLIEIDLDGRTIVSRSVAPSGLFGDGPSQIYENFEVPAGSHKVSARLRDSDRAEGFDFSSQADVVIAPLERFVIEFRAESGGFNFRGVPVPGVSHQGTRG